MMLSTRQKLSAEICGKESKVKRDAANQFSASQLIIRNLYVDVCCKKMHKKEYWS